MKPLAKSRGAGPSSRCKDCARKAFREWREKPESKELERISTREWRKNNPDKVRAYKKTDRERNPEKRREEVRKCHERNGKVYKANSFPKWLKERYGLTLEEYLALGEIQLERCAICQTDELDGDRRSRLCIDHCHESGEVRGLLCFSCNTMLGNAKDRIETLQRAIEYLQQPEPFTRTFVTDSYLSKNDPVLEERLWEEKSADLDLCAECLEENDIEEVFA